MSTTATGCIKSKYFVQEKAVNHGGGVKYTLGAVIPDYGNEPEGPDAGYHQSTPSGDATLHYFPKSKVDPGFEPDTHVIMLWTPIDDEREVDHAWVVKRVTYLEHDIVSYLLEPRGKDRPYSWGTEFDISIDTKFTPARFGMPGQRFTLEMSKK